MPCSAGSSHSAAPASHLCLPCSECHGQENVPKYRNQRVTVGSPCASPLGHQGLALRLAQCLQTTASTVEPHRAAVYTGDTAQGPTGESSVDLKGGLLSKISEVVDGKRRAQRDCENNVTNRRGKRNRLIQEQSQSRCVFGGSLDREHVQPFVC